jgi:hypothetical protein
MAISINQKYVKQTNEMLLNAEANLELIATQLNTLSAREQNKLFRVILNYISIVADSKNAGMKDSIELSKEIMETVNLYYEENQ